VKRVRRAVAGLATAVILAGCLRSGGMTEAQDAGRAAADAASAAPGGGSAPATGPGAENADPTAPATNPPGAPGDGPNTPADAGAATGPGLDRNGNQVADPAGGQR
jgi:hypothetical protein